MVCWVIVTADDHEARSVRLGDSTRIVHFISCVHLGRVDSSWMSVRQSARNPLEIRLSFVEEVCGICMKQMQEGLVKVDVGNLTTDCVRRRKYREAGSVMLDPPVELL